MRVRRADGDLPRGQLGLGLGLVGGQPLEQRGTDKGLTLSPGVVLEGERGAGGEDRLRSHSGDDLAGGAHVDQDGVGLTESPRGLAVGYVTGGAHHRCR